MRGWEGEVWKAVESILNYCQGLLWFLRIVVDVMGGNQRELRSTLYGASLLGNL